VNEEYDLPSEWVQTTLGDVTAPIRISVQPKEFPTHPFVGMEHVEAETMKLISTVPASELKSNAVRFWPGDVLYGRLQPYLNKVLRPDFEGLCSAEFLVFRESPHLNSRYLQYFLNSWSFKEFASHLNEGDRPRVDWSQLQGFQFPLPPLPEQQRIVAAIEQQFSRLDAGVAALRRAQTTLKRYRAAVLKAAVEGKLTEAWRTEHPTTEPASKLLDRILAERRAKWEADLRAKGKDPAKVQYVEPAKPDVASLQELPKGWCWATVEQISQIQGGIQKQPSRTPRKNAFPYLRVANVLRGRLDLSVVEKMELFGNELDTLRLQLGDMLIVEGNGSRTEIGRSALWNGAIEDCVHQNHIIRVRLSFVIPEYLDAYWNSPIGSRRVMDVAGSTSGLYTLSVGKVSRLPIRLPSIAEQEQIVSEVERRLSVVSQLEATVETNLKRAERLRQSILKEAFAGRLVPQDPDDEPASVLLERIRRDREKRKHGALDKGREVICEIPRPKKIDVKETRQVELWGSVGSGE